MEEKVIELLERLSMEQRHHVIDKGLLTEEMTAVAKCVYFQKAKLLLLLRSWGVWAEWNVCSKRIVFANDIRQIRINTNEGSSLSQHDKTP